MVTEVLWVDAFPVNTWGEGRDSIEYDPKTLSHAKALELAKEKLVVLQKIREAVMASKEQGQPMWVKLTKGAKAGTIGRVHTNSDLTIFLQDDERHNTDKTKVTILDTDSWRDGCGSILFPGQISGKAAYDSKAFILTVDGKEVHNFTMGQASIKSCRPALLLDYDGPEVFVRGQGSKHIGRTIKDRYDRDVSEGDLAIVAAAKGGTLYVGKITKITDARTVTIKHIGASVTVQLTNVQDHQVLKLTDDIKQVLMMEKLKGL